MQRISAIYKQTAEYVNSNKRKSLVALGAVIILAGYGVVFFLPKTVQFSFTGKTCAKSLTIFPDIHTTNNSDYDVSFLNTGSLFGQDLISTTTCFTPNKSPDEGTQRVAVAPFGSFLASRQYAVTVENTPKVKVEHIDTTIPTSRAMSIPLTTTDTIHTYTLSVGEKKADCKGQNSTLECNIPALNLKQGKTYEIALSRRYNANAAEAVMSMKITTLKAVKVTKSSIKNKQTVYAKPKTFTFVTDKDVKKADVEIIKKGSKAAEKSETEISGRTVTVRVAKELSRE